MAKKPCKLTEPHSIDIAIDETLFVKGLVHDGDDIEIGYPPHKIRATVHKISESKGIIRTFPYTVEEIGIALKPQVR